MVKYKEPEYENTLQMVKFVLLLSKSLKPVPIETLTSEIGCHKKTINRYTKALNKEFSWQDGVDFINIVKKNGVNSLYLTHNDIITTSFFKAASIYTGRMILNSMGGTIFQDGLDQAYEMVKDALHISEKNTLRSLDRKIRYSGFARKDYSKKNEIIRVVLEALINNSKVQTEYESYHSKKERILILHPYTQFLHKDSLYLHALIDGSKKIKTFAIDRIKEVLDLKENFRYPNEKKYDPATIADESFGIYEIHGEEPVEVSVMFNSELYQYVTSRKWHRTQSFSTTDNDTFTMKLKLSNTKEFLPWILQFGRNAQVIKPDRLKEDVKRELIKALENY